MLLAKQMSLMHLTGGYFDRAFGSDYTKQWALNPLEVTEIERKEEAGISELDEGILNTAVSVEELLIRFVSLLHDRHQLGQTNLLVDQLLKRYILAVVAISCIDEERLDGALSLNLQLPTIPIEGVQELLGTVDDIRDFYSCVNDPATATTTIRVIPIDYRPTDAAAKSPSVIHVED